LLFMLVLGCWHSAHAKAGEDLIDFGQELSKWVALRVSDQARVLELNNVQIHVASASTSLNLHDTMLRLHGLCGQTCGFEIPDAIRRRLGSKPQSEKLGLVDGVYSQELGDSGVIACLDTGGRLLLDDMTARLQRFTKTRDLGSLGSLRYVLARRSKNGTTVLALWTDGAAPILGMFPSKGDAPGRDPEGVPRPDGIRRLLSAHENGLPYAVTVYESASIPLSELRGWYTQSLVDKGWTLKQTRTQNCVVAQARDRSLNICWNNAAGRRILVTIAELS
jgi:hypothetical protein